MAKPRRIHAPGCIVHITARTHGRKPWFTESLRSRVATEILAAGQASGHSVLAFVIMPNHFHIVVRQCTQELSALMHRVMHRSAALLRSSHCLQGHVYQRRYWSGICADAAHVRATIAYVHLNPCRADLCSEPDAYVWSSHHHYLQSRANPADGDKLDTSSGLRLFQSDDSPSSARRNYLAHVHYQMNVDRFLAGELIGARLVAPETCTAGDAHWAA